MIQLPKCAAPLADLTDKAGMRLTAIQLLANGTTFTLVATDGKALGIVSGPVEPEGQEAAILIPGDKYRDAFKLLKKQEDCVSLDLNTNQFLTEVAALAFKPEEGRFPDLSQILPKKKIPLVRVKFNPALLVRVLKAAAAICPDADLRVEFLFYGSGQPIGLVAIGENGVTFDALVMPLT